MALAVIPDLGMCTQERITKELSRMISPRAAGFAPGVAAPKSRVTFFCDTGLARKGSHRSRIFAISIADTDWPTSDRISKREVARVFFDK